MRQALADPAQKERAFRQLVADYGPRLHAHILRMVSLSADADDVLQNTLVKAYRRLDRYRGDSKLYTWLYRIATNESITLINKNAKRMQVSNEEVQELAVNNLKSDVYFEGDAIQFKLQQAIASLPQKQQLVFNMKYFEDIKYKDMADILETSEGALKASYHIAVKKIESFLTGN